MNSDGEMLEDELLSQLIAQTAEQVERQGKKVEELAQKVKELNERVKEQKVMMKLPRP